MGKRKILLAAVFVLALAVASATAFLGQSENRYPHQAEFAVQNLTCAACVGKVQRALSAVEGVGKTHVNVLSGRTRVEFDPELIDTERIAAAITAAGYPAIPQQGLSAEALQALQTEAQRLSADYVGRIGGRLVARADFERELERMRASLPPQHSQMPAEALKKLVWQNVVQHEILLSEADRRQMIVSNDEAGVEIEKMRSEGLDFNTLLAQVGGEENLVRRVKEGLLIDRLIEEQMNEGGLPRDQARIQLERWYRNLSATTPVEVFDPALRSGQGGCGPGCC